MDARIKVIFLLTASICATSCNSASINVKSGLVPDATNCRPRSIVSAEIAKSQMACHQGVSGDGVQVLLSNTTRRASMRSDTAKRELTSIFIQPAGSAREVGPVRFDAFYSQGLVDLTGKTGCVGVLEDGFARVEKVARKSVLTYSMRFRLVSPLGWQEDCKEPRQISGSVELSK